MLVSLLYAMSMYGSNESVAVGMMKRCYCSWLASSETPLSLFGSFVFSM